MTKSDKETLRHMVRNRANESDEYMALVCSCSIETVRKYRRIAAASAAALPRRG